jgi:hypothetical protein
MKGTIDKIEFNRKFETNTGRIIFYFNVWITDETGKEMTGQFSTVKEDQDKFIIGKEYELTVEVKTTQKGEYNFINKAKTDKNVKAPVKGKAWKRDVSVRRSIIAQSSLDSAVTALNAIISTWPELGIQDKITKIGQISGIADNMMKWVAANSGSNEQMEIICQSSLKKAVAIISIKSLNVKSTDDILKAAGEFKDLAVAGTEKLIPLIPE